MDTPKKTYNVFEIKDFFESKFQKSHFSLPLPVIETNSDGIQISFRASRITPSILLDSLVIISSSVDQWRISGIEKGYLSVQAPLPGGAGKYGMESLRIRFTLYADYSTLHCSKSTELSPAELHSIYSLFEFLSGIGENENQNPKEILTSLGVTVFDPVGEELKNGDLYTFKRIAGYESVKRQIQETIIYPLKHPEIFEKVSSLTRQFHTKNKPRAILFEGDPGVGKTTMAKIVAAECGIPLVYVPIESILSKYYGESSRNLALVFEAAALFPSCLIFLDEIDSLAGKREDGMFDANRKLLSVLLRKLDGFESSQGTITLGATNRKNDLDPALLSRFDRSIYFPLPSAEERAKILKTYANHLEEEESIQISLKMESFSGRTIKDFCDQVERGWSTEILLNKREISPPPLAFYLDLIKIYRLNHLDI